MVGKREEAVLRGCLHVGDPVGRHAGAEQLVGGQGGENRPRRWSRPGWRGCGGGEVVHALAQLDDLEGAGLGVGGDAAALGPGIGGVVVVDIGEQEAAFGLVDDDADVGVGADGPEIAVARGVYAVEVQAWGSGV